MPTRLAKAPALPDAADDDAGGSKRGASPTKAGAKAEGEEGGNSSPSSLSSPAAAAAVVDLTAVDAIQHDVTNNAIGKNGDELIEKEGAKIGTKNENNNDKLCVVGDEGQVVDKTLANHAGKDEDVVDNDAPEKEAKDQKPEDISKHDVDENKEGTKCKLTVDGKDGEDAKEKLSLSKDDKPSTEVDEIRNTDSDNVNVAKDEQGSSKNDDEDKRSEEPATKKRRTEEENKEQGQVHTEGEEFITISLKLPPAPQKFGFTLQDDMHNFGIPFLVALRYE